MEHGARRHQPRRDLRRQPLWQDNSLFKSTDGGVNWDSLFPAGSEVASTVQYTFFQALSIDPTDHTHIAVTFHAECSGPNGPNCMADTHDAGATWRIFKGPLSMWGEAAGPYVLPGGALLMSTPQNGLFYTSDGGANWEKVGPGCNGITRANDQTYYCASDYGIQKSSDGHVFSSVKSGPNGNPIVDTGTRLFTSRRNDTGQTYYVSPSSDGQTWSKYASPDLAHGAVNLGYDPDHHILYSANTTAGLFRIVTQ